MFITDRIRLFALLRLISYENLSSLFYFGYPRMRGSVRKGFVCKLCAVFYAENDIYHAAVSDEERGHSALRGKRFELCPRVAYPFKKLLRTFAVRVRLVKAKRRPFRGRRLKYYQSWR